MGGKHHSKQTSTKHRASQKHPKVSVKSSKSVAKQQQLQVQAQVQANSEQQQQLGGLKPRDGGASTPTTGKPQLQENLSFCGCGFLGIYHVGVASCFHEYAPQISMHKISGSSAGALVAVAHMCGNLQLAYATTDILRIAIDARARALGPLHPSFDINAVITEALEKGLPDDVHERVSGKLHISLTRLDDLANVVVSKFDSKEEIIQALICSCFIPCWSGFAPPKYKGVAYIDGGFSNNLLILDDKTLTVSPFAGEADICPRDDVYNLLTISISNTSFSMTPHNLYRLSHALIPPPPEVLSELCERGFADGIRFLQKMKLISCTRCREIQSSLLVSRTNEMEIIETETTFQRRNSTASFDSYGEVTKTKTTTTTTTKTTTTKTTTSCSASGTPLDGHSLNWDAADEEDQHDEMCEEQPQRASEQLHETNAVAASLDEHDCDGCILRRKNALRDPLPKLFTDRIREACDNVNKSLYNWFVSHRPIKYLSYLAAPYYLPMNISLALLLKYGTQLPHLSAELFRCLTEVKDFLMEVARRVYDRSTTSMLMSSDTLAREEEQEKQQAGAAKSSISVKITTDCREFSKRSLTSYECCLTIVLFGRRSLLSMQK